MKGKYKVIQFYSVQLDFDDSGNYIIKRDATGNFKLHSWRIGKHTKGKFQGEGQVFKTENNLFAAIVKANPVAFKDRHSYTPMDRFTSQFISKELLKTAQQELNKEQK